MQEQAKSAASLSAGVQAGPEPGTFVLDVDVQEALSQPWAQLVLRDDFGQLREQFLAAPPAGPPQASLQGDLQAQVQLKAMEFMQLRCEESLLGCKLLESRVTAPAAVV